MSFDGERSHENLFGYYRKVNEISQEELKECSELQIKIYENTLKDKKYQRSSLKVSGELIKDPLIKKNLVMINEETSEKLITDLGTKLGLIDILLSKLRNFFNNSLEENLFILNFLIKLMSIPVYINSEDSFILHNTLVEPRENYKEIDTSLLKVLVELANQTDIPFSMAPEIVADKFKPKKLASEALPEVIIY